jgi:hypothetical protein
MDDRRLVGIDLGITSAHTIRVLAGDGSLVSPQSAPDGGESRRGGAGRAGRDPSGRPA